MTEVLTTINLRGLLIPPEGRCVSTESELFEEIDSGERTYQAAKDLAQQSCHNCIQVTTCSENRKEIATTLFRLGNGTTLNKGQQTFMVAGEAIVAQPEALQERIMDLPAFRFNLRELPNNSTEALRFLRRGVRAKQFYHEKGAHPPELKVLATQFLEQLAIRNPKFHAELTDTKNFKSQALALSLESIHLVLCQQADFSSLTTSYRTPQESWAARRVRCDPTQFDMEQNFPIITQYLQDVRDLTTLGFYDPPRQALAYSAEDYRRLLAQYQEKIHDISLSELRHITKRHWREPEIELAKYFARLHENRCEYPQMPESALRIAARLNRPVNAGAEKKLLAQYQDHEYIGPGVVRQMCSLRPDPDKALSEIEQRVDGALIHFGRNHPVVTLEAMAEFATKHGDQTYIDALEKYAANYRTYSQQLEGSLSPSDIRRLARRSDQKAKNIVSLLQKTPEATAMFIRYGTLEGEDDEEIIRARLQVRRLTKRFQARREHHKESIAPEAWEIWRIMALYRQEEDIDRVAEQLYTLSNEKAIISNCAAPAVLQDLNFRHPLKSVPNAPQNQYLTFGPQFQGFEAIERLALAEYWGVSRLLYGQSIDPAQLTAALGKKDSRQFAHQKLLPKYRTLSAQKTNGNPISLAQLSEDLLQLSLHSGNDLVNEDALPLEPRDYIVGAQTVSFAMESIVASSVDDAAIQHWLQRLILERYGVDTSRAALDVSLALETGILEICGTGIHRRVMLSPVHRKASELQRVVLACSFGIDRLLYGRDMREVLHADVPEQFRRKSAVLSPNEPITPINRRKTSLEQRQALNEKQMRQVEAGMYASAELERILAIPENQRANVATRGAPSLSQHISELREIAREGEAVQEHMITQTGPLLEGLVRKWEEKCQYDPSISRDDIRQWAYMGIHKALERHDYRGGALFETFAMQCAHDTILTMLWKTSSNKSFTSSSAELNKKIETAKKALQDEGQPLDDRAIAKRAGMSSWKYAQFQAANLAPTSLDRPTKNGDEDGDVLELADPNDNFLEAINDSFPQFKKELWRLIVATLEEQSQKLSEEALQKKLLIARLAFGLDGESKTHHTIIAKRAGLTQSGMYANLADIRTKLKNSPALLEYIRTQLEE